MFMFSGGLRVFSEHPPPLNPGFHTQLKPLLPYLHIYILDLVMDISIMHGIKYVAPY